MTKLNWTDLDAKAVDTCRVLAMDAVQKVGNGHPGTAMSLAPVAYLLFQKKMRHSPADPAWTGRDRFVLSCGHSSITLYTQLFLGGFGLELDDLKSLRTWGSKTPGHPEHGHTAGVETTTGPLGQGVANAVGMAMAARRERGLLDPDAAEGASPFDHHIYAMCSDGDLEEGVSGEASSIAGHQQLGNLTLIYDANRISIEGDTDIAFSEDVGRRYEAYGWHVQTVDWTNDGTEYVEDVDAVWKALEKADRATDKPSLIVLRTIIAWPAPQRPEHRQGARLRARRRRGRGHQEGPRLRPRPDLRGVRGGARAHPRRWSSGAARRPGRLAGASSTPGPRRTPTRKALFDRMSTRTLPDGWADAPPVVRRRPEGRRDPQGLRRGPLRDRAGAPRALGRLRRPRRVQQHDAQGRAVVRPGGVLDEGVPGRPLRPGPPLRHPRARHGLDHERHRPARRHPRVRRHLPGLLRLHAPRGPARRR